MVGNGNKVRGNQTVVFANNKTVTESNRLVVNDYSMSIDDDPNNDLDVRKLSRR